MNFYFIPDRIVLETYTGITQAFKWCPGSQSRMSFAEDTTYKELFVMVMGRCIRTNCEVAVPDISYLIYCYCGFMEHKQNININININICREFTWNCPEKWQNGDWFLYHECAFPQSAVSMQELLFRNCRTFLLTYILLRLVYMTEVNTRW